MAIDLNVTPYYNDFSSAKKFNRVVFKPGVAVQARELTQLQDYMLNTIKEFGDFVFKDGATVRGGSGYPINVPYIKVNDVDAAGTAVSNDTLANYVGDTLTGSATGIKAEIESVKTGTDSDAVKKKTFYLNYTKGNELESGTIASSIRFEAGETLTVTSTDSGRNGDTFVVDSNTDIASFTKNFYGYAIDFVIEEGIVYAQGKFIAHDTQKLRLDDYNMNVNFFVGIKVNESIVTSDDDTSLLDPATGAYNYNAPGADRTKIDTVITKVPYGKDYTNSTIYEIGEFISNGDNIYEVTTAGTSNSSGSGPVHTTGNATDGTVVFKFFEMPTGFTTLYKIKAGQIQKKYDTRLNELAELGKAFAVEKNETDGDYVITPFTMKIVEHLKTVKGVSFNTTTNTNYSVGQFVNHLGKLYEVSIAGTSSTGSPPTHTSGDVLSGTATFGYRGSSYRLDNEGYRFSTNATDPGDANYLMAIVSPGIAYANGFRREFYKNQPIKVRKGTSSEIKEARDVTLGYGNYFNVTEVVGTFDLENGAICNIGYYGSVGSQTGAAAHSDGTFGGHAALGTTIGTCRVRALKRASGNPGAAATQYRLFVYDVRVRDGDLKDARCIQFPNSTDSGFADIILDDTDGNGVGDSAFLHGTDYNKLVYQAPWQSTKTLAAAGGGSYDTQYYYTEEFNVSVPANGVFSISTASLGSEVIFPYTAAGITQTILDNKIYMVCKTSGITDIGDGTTISGSEGRVIRIAPSMVTSAANGQTMEFDVGTPSGTYDAYLQVEVKVVDAVPVPKALNTGRYVKIDTRDNIGGANGPWPLGIVDVKEIEAIYVSSDLNTYLDDSDKKIDYKKEFIVDSGQTDNFYGHGKIIKKTSSSLSTTDKLLTIKLSHFTANYGGSNGTYFAKDSYPVDDTGATGIYTFEIPYHNSKRLGNFNLRDCIDFRPRVKQTAVSATTLAVATENPYPTEDFDLPSNGIQFPTPNSSFTTDIEYYLPRIDKVVISKAGEIKVIEGISSLPARGPAMDDAMQIAEIQVPPFPSLAPGLAQKYGQEINAVFHKLEGQHRRYTMQDIGAIEKRINRLEYYLALSLMEMQAKDQVILDANGNDRFKNGIYVNAFEGDLLSDLTDPSYAASYDSERKRLGPNFEDYQVDLKLNDTHGTSGWTQQGSSITRPYILEAGLENRFATKIRNCVGELLFNYDGEMDLFPRSDTGATVKTQETKNVITLSNASAVQAQAESFNASPNAKRFETSFEMGKFDADNQVVEPGSRPVAKEMITIDGGGDAGGTISGDVSQSITTLNGGARNGWFEQTSAGGLTGEIGGTISASATATQTMQVQDIVQKTTSIITTAQAMPVSSQTHSLGNFVSDVSLLPNMRGNRIGVRVRRMKPNTRLYFYFDDVRQDDRCCPCHPSGFDALIPRWKASGSRTGHIFLHSRLNTAPLGGVEDADKNYLFSASAPADIGSPIVTDANGDAAFVYWLPRGNDGTSESAGLPTFSVGTRRMRVTDDPDDRYNFVTTQAEQIYSAFAMNVFQRETDIIYEQHAMSLSSTSSTTMEKKGEVVTDVDLQPGEMTINADLTASIDATAPSFIHHPPIQRGDPIAQTFGIGDAPSGAFVKKVRVWFRDRPGQTANTTNSATDTGQGITCEIRKVLNGFPTDTVLSGGRKFLKATEVKTTPDISGNRQTNYDYTETYATDFEFDEPLYVAPNEEYALVLMPQRNDPNYNVWCSKLGENKIGTNERVTAEETDIAGMLFTSSNNRAWSPHQTEDIKYVVYYERFTVGSGTVEFVNEDAEYIVASDYLNGRPVDGQDIHAFKVGIAGGGTGYSVNDIITLNAINVQTATSASSNNLSGSGVKLKVTSVSGGVVDGIEVYDAGIGFRPQRASDTPANVTIPTTGQSTVTPTGGSGATFTLKIKHGQIDEVDSRTEKMELIYDKETIDAAHGGDSDYFFAVNDIIGTGDPITADSQQGFNRNTSFKINSIYNKAFNNLRTNMTYKEFPEANVTMKACVTNSAGSTAAGSTFTDILPVRRTPTTLEAALFSAKNEFAFTGGNKLAKKSYRHRYTLSTTSTLLSPVISLYRNAAILRKYEINNDSTNETTNLGNAKSKFISRRVRLADGQEAEDLRLSVALRQPAGSSFKVYFKGQAQEDDGDFYEDLPWVEMELDDTNPKGIAMSQSQFIDFNYKLPSTALDASGVFTQTVKRVNALSIGTAGSGIASASSVNFSFSGGGSSVTRQAAIKCTALSAGGLATLEIVDPGRGYSTAPTVKVFDDHAVSKYYATGTIVGNSGNIYEATVGGTTGASSASSAPTHGSGTATDGTVTWTFRGTRPAVTCTVADTEFKRFKYFSSKLVMLSSNTSVIPEAKQLRIIALQA
tara:strand:- start:2411 stop:9514 length:7104 start_codon:yes stop_codon:yes gene_type:complete